MVRHLIRLNRSPSRNFHVQQLLPSWLLHGRASCDSRNATTSKMRGIKGGRLCFGIFFCASMLQRSQKKGKIGNSYSLLYMNWAASKKETIWVAHINGSDDASRICVAGGGVETFHRDFPPCLRFQSTAAGNALASRPPGRRCLLFIDADPPEH